MGYAYVKGLQSEKVAAMVKHYVRTPWSYVITMLPANN